MSHRVITASLAAALICFAGASARAAIVKGPYLQNVTKTSVIVVWETDSSTAGEVRLVTVAGLRTIPAASGTMHEVLVDGLSQDTPFTYSVVSGGTTSASATFVTAPSRNTPFMFVAFGDNRDGDTDHAALVARMVQETPDFAVGTGDMVASDASGEWSTFFTIEKPLLMQTPFFPAIGNHELVPGSLSIPPANYRKYFVTPTNGQDAERNYSYVYGNSKFIVLDGNNASSTGQRDWLRGQLMAGRADPDIDNIFASVHHAVYSSSNHGSTASEQSLWQPLFDQFNVEIVFQGHDHTYEHLKRNNTHYLTLGGMGAPLYGQDAAHPDKQYSLLYAMQHHFGRIRVDGDFIEFHALKADGTVLDTFTIGTRPVPGADGGVTTTDGGTTVTPDGGTQPTTDAAVGPTVDAGPDTGGVSDSGCGCKVPGRRASSALAAGLGMIVLGLMVVIARRRRR